MDLVARHLELVRKRTMAGERPAQVDGPLGTLHLHYVDDPDDSPFAVAVLTLPNGVFAGLDDRPWGKLQYFLIEAAATGADEPRPHYLPHHRPPSSPRGKRSTNPLAAHLEALKALLAAGERPVQVDGPLGTLPRRVPGGDDDPFALVPPELPDAAFAESDDGTRGKFEGFWVGIEN
jgi:hypothetical protein